MKIPCQGCEDRHPLCHSECERYIAWKAERDAGREAAWHGLEAKHFLIENVKKAQRRFKK